MLLMMLFLDGGTFIILRSNYKYIHLFHLPILFIFNIYSFIFCFLPIANLDHFNCLASGKIMMIYILNWTGPFPVGSPGVVESVLKVSE